MMSNLALADLPRFQEQAGALVKIVQTSYQRGWSPATSGNYSVRWDAESCLITASGCDKSRLTLENLVRVDWQDQPLSPGKPSAETHLHTALYQRYPQLGAVLHTHSPYSTVLGRCLKPGQALRLTDYELLKAFPGVKTHQDVLFIPVFDNTQDMKILAQAVNAYLDQIPLAGQLPCQGYIIRGHGLYTWGADLGAAWRHLEALEFLLQNQVMYFLLMGLKLD